MSSGKLLRSLVALVGNLFLKIVYSGVILKSGWSYSTASPGLNNFSAIVP